MSDHIKRGPGEPPDERQVTGVSESGGGIGWPEFTADALLDDPDLGLITDYLSNELPPEQVALVKRRLDEDEKFRELAAPLLLTWSVPPLWKREPMPRADIVEAWDQFTRRAGFVHQREKAEKARKRRRRRWMIGGLIVLLAPFAALGLYMASSIFAGYRAAVSTAERLRDGPVSWGEFAPLSDSIATPDADGWMSVAGARVKLDSGAKLSRSTSPLYPSMVRLDQGSARFQRLPTWKIPPSGDTTSFSVYTPAGILLTLKADFRVSVRGDTTDVEVLRRDPAENDPQRAAKIADDEVASAGMPDHVAVGSARGGRLLLRAGEMARMHPPGQVIMLRSRPK